MQPKEIAELKEKMLQVCNKAIDEILDQLVYNENDLKVNQSDPYASLRAIDLDIKFLMNVEDKDGKLKPFQMFCNPKVNLK